MKWDRDYWEKTWFRDYKRYNQHHREIWDALIPYLKGNIADLGCGTAVMYEGKNVSLIGLDWSEEALKQAKLHYPWGQYVLAKAEKTGLPSDQFDTIIMSGLLDYFEDWTELLTEARRILKKDGIIVATLLQGFNGHNWTEDVVRSKTDIKLFKHAVGNWFLIEM